MLIFLEIENFRCFENFKIEGLAQVNLFGGLNNSGKTALLEAFALATNYGDFFYKSAFVNIRNLKESSQDTLPR
jgi:AAA15 family ATPase/GTPase